MFETATAEQAHAILAAAHRVTQLAAVPDDPRCGLGAGGRDPMTR